VQQVTIGLNLQNTEKTAYDPAGLSQLTGSQL